MAAVADLRFEQRSLWAAGDYAAVAEFTDATAPRDLLDRVRVAPGQHVLDVATGTGSAALRAAAAGAHVVGLDLTPELLATARRRAADRGMDVAWVEGDAERLPFEAARFDRVLSVFGAQFVARHELVARELVRVCRPGGRIGLVNWTPRGPGQLLGILARRLPLAPWALWGTEAPLRELFAGHGVELAFTRGRNPWRFESPEHFVLFMETHCGPVVRVREQLIAEDRWEACRTEILALTERCNEATDGSLLLHADYLVAVGTTHKENA